MTSEKGELKIGKPYNIKNNGNYWGGNEAYENRDAKRYKDNPWCGLQNGERNNRLVKEGNEEKELESWCIIERQGHSIQRSILGPKWRVAKHSLHQESFSSPIMGEAKWAHQK